MNTTPMMQLNDGHRIPQVGLGLWRVKDESEFMTSFDAAVTAGYTHLDTAQVYINEQFLGAAWKKHGLRREDIFITTKLWNDNQWWDDVEPSMEESLKNLQTDYVDLFLVHFPATDTRRPAWRKMEKLLALGKAKSIGVSNYTVAHLEELLHECTIKPVVNQVELHLFLQQPELVGYCQRHGIVIEAYSPLAHGQEMDDSTVIAVAQKHHKTYAQVMLRWLVQQGFVVLPKSVTPERVRQNIDLFDFELDDEDMRRLAELDRNLRTCWDPTHIP